MLPPAIPTIDCNGTPRAMGRQYGEAVRDAIRYHLDVWYGKTGLLYAHIAFASATCALLERKAPDVLEEMEGLAEESGIDIDILIVESAIGSPMTQQCTSIAIGSGSDGCVLGKNNDGVSAEERLWSIVAVPAQHYIDIDPVLPAGTLTTGLMCKRRESSL